MHTDVTDAELFVEAADVEFEMLDVVELMLTVDVTVEEELDEIEEVVSDDRDEVDDVIE